MFAIAGLLAIFVWHIHSEFPGYEGGG